MRLFFAVEFEESLKDAIARAIEKAGIEEPPWRWVAPHNFHITLKFLGETPEERVKPLVMSAAGAFRRMPPFQIQ
ncbi:MAG: 2'-5' RNA ligase family protein, partial [bacterium]